LGAVETADSQAVAAAVGRAHKAFLAWRLVPPPRRGELVRRFGDVLRAEKEALGRLVSRECGKILSEGLGEVQEMIDICDFAVGLSLGPRVARRFGRSLLELGGNNAMIVAPSADLGLAERAIAFAAMGTAGQRCTTLRRLFVHEAVYDRLVPRLIRIWAGVAIGDPLQEGVLVGPLIDSAAVEAMQAALAEAAGQGGTIHGGQPIRGCFVRPALVEMPAQSAVMVRETFAPILYVLRCRDMEEAIALQNDVPQGLASSI